jgi:CheY-like chemotaxis protein
MSEFVSRVSHELRTPLNAILGFAQLLERDAEDPHARERATQISVAGTHLVALIDDLLDLGQLERGALRVSLEPVSATEVVRMTLELARPLIDERGLELELDLHDGLYAYVSADFRRLRQVLLNLVANAVKYNRERGKITVRFARADPERLRFVVADTGPGVPEDVLPRLFAPFDRLGAERGSEPGTGLGLAVSKALIEAMDGTIGVENGDGEGASFWVELGLVAPPEDEAEPGPAVRAARAEGATPPAGTVLYVEDNPANVRLMEEIFEGLPGLRLLTALEGGTGIELAAAERPDLVLLDAQLPDLPGEEVLDRLRADAATAEVPVLVVSADATDRHRRAFLARGAAGYLTKPLDVPAFVDELGRLLDRAG